MLDEQEPAVELVSVLALHGEAAVGVEVVGPEFEDGAPERGDPGVVTGSGDEDSVVEFGGVSEVGLVVGGELGLASLDAGSS